MRRGFRRQYPKNPDGPLNAPEDDPFEKVAVYIPRSLAYILKAKSDELRLPVSRLICIAIDNELDVETPFNYPCPLPASPFMDYAYANEAAKMAKYLERFPGGTGRDSLMLCRRDMDIHDRAVFMLGYRELLESNMIEEYRPRRTKFAYAHDYQYTRLKDPQINRKNRYKRIAGELPERGFDAQDVDD